MIAALGIVLLAGSSSLEATAGAAKLHPRAVLGDLGYVLSTPARLDGGGAWKLAAFSGLTLASVLWFDEPLNERYARDQNDAPLGLPSLLSRLGRASELYTTSSTNLFIVSSTGGLFLVGWALDDSKAMGTAGLMLEAVVFTKAIVPFGKRGFGRARPFLGEGAHQFDGPKWTHDRPRRSFPSGHTSTMFALMTVVAKRYPSRWVAVPAYAFAASVAFQRIESNNHWFSDTLAGGAVGYLIADALVERHRGKTAPGQALLPWLRAGSVGAICRVQLN